MVVTWWIVSFVRSVCSIKMHTLCIPLFSGAFRVHRLGVSGICGHLIMEISYVMFIYSIMCI